jgi:hypothetical protein
MIKVYDQAGALLGALTEEQLKFLIDQFEEESLEDQDYSLTAMEIDYLESQGAEAELVRLLRLALGEKAEATIRWQRE